MVGLMLSFPDKDHLTQEWKFQTTKEKRQLIPLQTETGKGRDSRASEQARRQIEQDNLI